MISENYPRLEEKYGSQVFQKFPLTIVRGSGASVWDDRGEQYVDCMAGFGVAITGHCNPSVVKAVRDQAEKLITCHGSFYNDARSEFLEKLARVSPKGLQSAILTNSGTESVEAAIKLARRYTGKREIISMKGGFHGKTFGALSATWGKKYREPFSPLVPNFNFVDYGDYEQLEKSMGQETAAVIAEPIQGESGIIVPPEQYLKSVREICDKRGVILILDEIQTGLGRTGRMWASDHWGVVPDIMTIAKGLGGGVPIGASLTTSEIMNSLKKGEHTSTFGGNPLACAAASANLDYISENQLPSVAVKKGRLFKSGLEKIASTHRIAREARGLGLMLALELRVDTHQILLKAISKHVIFAYAGKNIVRLLPPIVISEEQIENALKVLNETVSEEGRRRFG